MAGHAAALVVLLVGGTTTAAWAVFADSATAGPVRFTAHVVAPVDNLRCESDLLSSPRLAWDAATGHTGYRVRLPGGGGVDLSRTTTTYTPDTAGDYQVRVVEGTWSSLPKTVTVRTGLLGGLSC